VTFEAHRNLARAPYLVALASDGELPDLSASLLVTGPDASGEIGGLRAEVQRLTDVEAAARRDATAYAALLTECEGLRQALQRAATESAGALEQAYARAAAQAREREEIAAEAVRAAMERAAAQRDERDAAVATAEQHGAASRLREQTIRRLQMDLVHQGRALTAALAEVDGWRTEAALQTEAALLARMERDAARAEAAHYAQAYDRVSKLLVPVWMRRLAPRGWRQAFGNRLLKRV
jgi:hypothetical protein